MKMIPPADSLLKYDNPVSVSRITDRKSPKVSPQQPPLSGPVPPPPKPRSPGADAHRQQTEEILNSLLPPREWAEAGQLWVQQVASTPCTRSDVVQLQGQLDELLPQRQARKAGICPVRRQLYSQCFDELIRQVTINCAERGVLLLRGRNEIRMMVAVLQTLYESSMAFGVSKALRAEKGKSDMETRMRAALTHTTESSGCGPASCPVEDAVSLNGPCELEMEKKDLERQLNEQKAKCEAVEKREMEIRQTEEREHGEEIKGLKRANQQLKAQLEVTIAPRNKRFLQHTTYDII